MAQRYLYSASKHDSIKISNTGMATTHPHHRIMMDYQKLMISYSDRLGLNPLARTKFEIKKKKEKSSIMDILDAE